MSEKASKRVLERCIPNMSSEVARSKAERLIFNGNQWVLESLGHCTLYICVCEREFGPICEQKDCSWQLAKLCLYMLSSLSFTINRRATGMRVLDHKKAAVGPMKIEWALRDLQTRSDKYPHHIMCFLIFQARRSGEEVLVEYKSLFESLVYFFLEVTPFPLGQLEQHDT